MRKFKRIAILCLTIFILVCCNISMSACDDLFASKGLTYTLNEGGKSYTVSGMGTCEEEKIVIPSTHNGLPVTGLGRSAFKGCKIVTKVTIPDSVTVIDNAAFSECTSLMSVDIPDSVKSVGDYAFLYCSSLTEVQIGNGVNSMGKNAFEGCVNLKKATFKDVHTWYVSLGDGREKVSSEDLSDPEKAAQYLTKDYMEHIWKKA